MDPEQELRTGNPRVHGHCRRTGKGAPPAHLVQAQVFVPGARIHVPAEFPGPGPGGLDHDTVS